jgi:hypothetical protein
MVKRFSFILLVLPVLLVARPASAQDFSRLDLMFGYGNYGVEDVAGTSLTRSRTHGFNMHTDINLTNWFTFENFTGAYSHPGDITLFTNTFGAKLIARDVVDGRVSPYVIAGIGFATFISDQSGGSGSTNAMRYAAGIDLNMSDAAAIRLDVGGLSLGSGILGVPGRKRSTNIAVGIVFSLGN